MALPESFEVQASHLTRIPAEEGPVIRRCLYFYWWVGVDGIFHHYYIPSLSKISEVVTVALQHNTNINLTYYNVFYGGQYKPTININAGTIFKYLTYRDDKMSASEGIPAYWPRGHSLTAFNAATPGNPKWPPGTRGLKMAKVVWKEVQFSLNKVS